MLIFTPTSVEVGGVVMTREELVSIRPDFPMPELRRVEYDGQKHTTWTANTQAGGPLPWAEGDALLADASLAADLDALRNPPPTLEQAKAIKRAKVNGLRDQAIAAGYSYSFPDGVTGTVDTREQSDFDNLQALTTLGQVLDAQGETEAVITFVDQEDAAHALTPAQMIALGVAITQQVAQIYAASWPIKQAIKAAATIEELNAVDINAGWP